MAQEFIYHMKGLRKAAGDGTLVLDGIWLSFYFGAKIGVIGPNGAGKSTLLRIMAGLDTSFEGESWLEPRCTVGFLQQEPKLDESLDVRGNIEKGLAHLRGLLDEFEQLSMRFSEPLEDAEMNKLLERQGTVQEKIDAANAWELDRMVEIAMDALRVPPGEAKVDTLSGGERRRVALCQLLLSQPDLLLLDEPTNHLDAESVAWLERTLREYHGTVIVVTHDRYFLDNVTGWILELDGTKGYPFEGNYSGWLQQKLERLAKESRGKTPWAKAMGAELDWVRMGLADRSGHAKARLREYDQRLQAVSAGREGRAEIMIPPGPRLGDVVVEAQGLMKGYGDRLLFENLTFALPRGGIVGVIGPNGAGKTTLFKMITGQEKADGGTLRVGDTVAFSAVEQTRKLIKDDLTVWENISGGNEEIKIGREKLGSRAYVASFGFKGTRQQQKVGTLSGGERNRVNLAMVLQAGGNVLLLDEPTNDLDVGTLRALEDALDGFPGCAVIITHDRWFLDRLATHMLAFEGDSQVVWFEGNYQEYEAARRRRLGAAADQPHRIKYKPLRR
ncbi:MAG: energy-dependent translational throttle protein EttA [Candidatus Schekmanbacteria bacterium]|nr:energy-dependent translational throttle protein EttA [Candidatus Schekmanbacteria bacterium]